MDNDSGTRGSVVDEDYLDSVSAARYVTAVGIFKFLESQSLQLTAQVEFLESGPERLKAVRARLEVVESEKIGARKKFQELERTLPMVMISRLSKALGTDTLANAAANDATPTIQTTGVVVTPT